MRLHLRDRSDLSKEIKYSCDICSLNACVKWCKVLESVHQLESSVMRRILLAADTFLETCFLGGACLVEEGVDLRHKIKFKLIL